MPRMTESTSKDEFSGLIYILSIKWDSIPLEASGTYQCSDSSNDTYPSASTKLKVFFDGKQLLTDFQLTCIQITSHVKENMYQHLYSGISFYYRKYFGSSIN